MNLVVDSGNTAAKVGIFRDEKLMEQLSFSSIDDLRSFLQQSSFQHVIVSSVRDDAALVASWASTTGKRLIMAPHLPVPLTSLYRTPESLGMDRLAGACGAWQLFPRRASLVIDAGTCVTYDLVDEHGRYHGGSISPGLMMRFRAVHTFTAKLPLLSPRPDVELVGKDTESSIQSGVVNGMIAEIEGMIARYSQIFPDFKVILCGGDTGFFENQLKASIFASPELVLIGLNSILIHNVNRL